MELDILLGWLAKRMVNATIFCECDNGCIG